MQVLANGGVFALAALLGAVLGSPWPAAGSRAALGALAASAADTWATEIGTLASAAAALDTHLAARACRGRRAA